MTDRNIVKHTEDFLRFVFPANSLFEIRGLGGWRPTSALFNDLSIAARGAFTLNGRCQQNVYYTLNTINPDSRLARSHLPWNQPLLRSYLAARDHDISTANLRLIDIDSKNRNGEPSTQFQLDEAFCLAADVKRWAKTQCWPEPIEIMSGNGVHLLFKGDGGPARSEVWEAALRQLARLFDTDTVAIDRSVGNPARISRMPGTINRKGTATDERPHRRAMVVSYPRQWEPLTNSMISSFANTVTDPARSFTERELVIDEDGVLQLIDEFSDHLELDSRGPIYEGVNTWFPLGICPFKGSPHKDQRIGKGKTALILTPATLGFKCFSDDCHNYGIGALLRHLRSETGRGPTVEIWEREKEPALDELAANWGFTFEDEDIEAAPVKVKGRPLTLEEVRRKFNN